MQLNFESETFAGIKRDMNFVLQRLLGNMQEKGATDGSMTLKIDVSFDTEYIPNYDPKVEGESRRIEKPKFKHKVTSTVQIKDEKSGNLDTEMELVFDEDSGEYVMKPIANTEQRSIFDSDFGADEEPKTDSEEEEKDSGIKSLPGPVAKQDEIIDAEFKEVTEESQQEPEADENRENEEELNEEELEDVTDELLGDSSGEDSEEDEDYPYDEPEGEE